MEVENSNDQNAPTVQVIEVEPQPIPPVVTATTPEQIAAAVDTAITEHTAEIRQQMEMADRLERLEQGQQAGIEAQNRLAGNLGQQTALLQKIVELLTPEEEQTNQQNNQPGPTAELGIEATIPRPGRGSLLSKLL